MTHKCVGCGDLDLENPPTKVMPRVIAGRGTEVMCAPCKAVVEMYLGTAFMEWCQRRQALGRIDRRIGLKKVKGTE